MARFSSQQLLERLKNGKLIPALLLLGEEPYLRDACRKVLVETFILEAARTWGVSHYSADRGETQRALEQAQTLPMLSRQQVVFLEDVEKIEKLGEKNRDAAVEQLEGYLADPSPFTVLVLEATALDQRMKLAKLLAEKTLVVEVGLGENPEQRLATAVTLAQVLASEEKVEFERGAAEDLAEFVAADLLRLQTEITKLATYVGDAAAISMEDVDVLCGRSRSAETFKIFETIGQGNPGEALSILERLLADGSLTRGQDEHLQLNEDTLWAGDGEDHFNPKAHEAFAASRQ